MELTAVPKLFYVDRSDRGRLRLTGKDRQSFLQGMVTNDVARLTPGQGCYAFMLDATGHVLADVRVLCLENALLLDVEPGMASFVAETLDRYLIMEKVRITDVSGELRQYTLVGNESPDVLARLGAAGAAAWQEGENAALEVQGDTAIAAAVRLTSVPAFDIYLPSSVDIDTVLGTEGALPHSLETLEALRIEAGIPRFGQDIDSRVLAPETGQQKRAVNYRKGCYIGQEIVARIDARGHTNRSFTGFTLQPGEPLPVADTPVTVDGRDAGRITSAALSPTLGVPIALGYLRHEFLEPGTRVTISGGWATVAALPFAASETGAATVTVTS
jgi:folate-binding protein YgfZ